MGVRVAQAEHGELYLTVIGREVDKTAIEDFTSVKGMSLIWELNNLRQVGNSQLILFTTQRGLEDPTTLWPYWAADGLLEEG